MLCAQWIFGDNTKLASHALTKSAPRHGISILSAKLHLGICNGVRCVRTCVWVNMVQCSPYEDMLRAVRKLHRYLNSFTAKTSFFFFISFSLFLCLLLCSLGSIPLSLSLFPVCVHAHMHALLIRTAHVLLLCTSICCWLWNLVLLQIVAGQYQQHEEKKKRHEYNERKYATQTLPDYIEENKTPRREWENRWNRQRTPQNA